ncbi:hypothetical protein HYV88_00140 [Candidatus Woesearchaeota archaeon]|nr:hypothetical protein [Candidatus Woesearchaeota archaeon]
MERESKIILGAIILILIAIFSFNLDITGLSVKEFSGMRISPKVVKSGSMILIMVYPGLGGVNNNLNFYNAEDDLRKASIELCDGDYKCSEETTISYWVPNNWKPGVYHVKVYDYNRKGFIMEDFTIKRGDSE